MGEDEIIGTPIATKFCGEISIYNYIARNETNSLYTSISTAVIELREFKRKKRGRRRTWIKWAFSCNSDIKWLFHNSLIFTCIAV